MPAGEIRVLGPVEVAEDDVLPLAAKHTRLLAALIVGQGWTRTVDELVESVWNRTPPASARNLVQVYVSQVRKALPDGIGIVTRGGAYALELTTEQLDSARFERLLGESETARRDGNPALAASLAERALALWRGRAFGELAYEDFARGEAERLEDLRLAALEERLDARLALGRHGEVVGEALALADEHPMRERTHELAMLALYRCGRQADALDHFASLRRRLRDELGLEPGAALRDLQRRILQQDPNLDAAAEDARPAQLPVPPSPLVGRKRELSQLAALLARRDARLIVLSGAGGSGKTRLALEAADQAAASFANGVRLVELAPLRDPDLVVPTIARGLGVVEDPDADADATLDALIAALVPQEVLLVLDNAEHVREAAPVFARVAAAAPRLTLLVTSRAVLHVSGERVFPVSPLPEDDAVELFVQRARFLEPTFALGADNEADVREICRRVDCLPLALELAAARIRTLTPRALRERLGARLGVLTGGPRDLPARQQTLRETIAWSVELLGPRERDVLARLAIAPGGVTLEAAEAVSGADLDTLTALVDDHLLLRADAGGEPRFGMLETVREYALELLGDARADAELALAEHFAEVADELRRSGSVERERRRIIDRLDPEIDNLRVALAAASTSGRSGLRVRLAGGLGRYWAWRGPVGEGLRWIESALAADDAAETVERANALHGGAGLAWMLGDRARARRLAEAAVTAAIEVGSKSDESAAHTVLGIVANEDGDRERARSHHQRSMELAEELGVEPVVEKLNLGLVALDSGEHEEAIVLFEEVVAANRRLERPAGMAIALLNLGLARHELGQDERSRRDFEEARVQLEKEGLRTQHAWALQGLAAVEASAARYETAARLLGQARRELDDVGTPEDAFAPKLVARTKEHARSALGDAAFDAVYAAAVEADTA